MYNEYYVNNGYNKPHKYEKGLRSLGEREIEAEDNGSIPTDRVSHDPSSKKKHDYRRLGSAHAFLQTESEEPSSKATRSTREKIGSTPEIRARQLLGEVLYGGVADSPEDILIAREEALSMQEGATATELESDDEGSEMDELEIQEEIRRELGLWKFFAEKMEQQAKEASIQRIRLVETVEDKLSKKAAEEKAEILTKSKKMKPQRVPGNRQESKRVITLRKKLPIRMDKAA